MNGEDAAGEDHQELLIWCTRVCDTGQVYCEATLVHCGQQSLFGWATPETICQKTSLKLTDVLQVSAVMLSAGLLMVIVDEHCGTTSSIHVKVERLCP